MHDCRFLLLLLRSSLRGHDLADADVAEGDDVAAAAGEVVVCDGDGVAGARARFFRLLSTTY